MNTNSPESIDWQNSTKSERDAYYASFDITCIGSESNTKDRCGYIKRKYKEWGLTTPSILDFPCHDGFVTRGFLKDGAIIVGFDIGIDAIKLSTEIAHRNYPRVSGYNWDYHLCSTDDFRWQKYETVFDLIVCFEFIEHITKEEVTTLLHRMDGVLAEDGHVAISTPQANGKYGTDGDDPTHINCYTVDSLREQIVEVLDVTPEIEEDDDFIYCSWRK